MRTLSQILWCCGFCLLGLQGLQAQALSNRVANYDIQVELDTEQRMIFATTELLWRNPSADTVRDLQFHVYYNAFKNNQSTFIQESGGIKGQVGQAFLDQCGWAATEVLDIRDQYGNDLTAAQRYIQPDDDNIADQTVLQVPLTTPVLPYDSIRVTLKWEAKIPKLIIRTGYSQDYYFMAQWFPKVGVYEPAGMRFATEGGWNCHQYHRSTEYYSDFGVYKVQITTPEGYVVGASGERIAEHKREGKQTLTYYIEDVIDFTWTAYPHFEEVLYEWENVTLRILRHPDRACLTDRYMGAAKYTLEYMNEHVGEYPYTMLTIVDPPYHGIRSSAMEYPTLVTGAGLYCFPKGIRTSESIATHEIVHQYFMQMLATNEQEEAWMDEGFTSYYQSRIIDEYYECIIEEPFTGFRTTDAAWRRFRFFNLDNPKIDYPGKPGWEFKHGGYHSIVYSKSALCLHTLDGLVGREKLDEIMRTYFEQWKFKHPCGQDFIKVVNEVTGEDMTWLFDQLIYGTEECDYAVTSISNRIPEEKLGRFDESAECVTAAEAGIIYESKVIVSRLGGVTLPVKLLVTFDDNSTKQYEWDGKARAKTFTHESTKKIVAARIDMDFNLPIDKNRINNSLTLEASKIGVWKYVVNALLWVQQLMESVSVLV